MTRIETLLRQAVDGDPAGQFALGNVYQLGLLDQEVDLVVARRWYELAARQDHVDAQTNLALLLLYGNSEGRTREDVLAARDWLERAATRGDVGAMAHLGHLHQHEEDAPRDPCLARVWLNAAAARGLRVPAPSEAEG